MPGSSRTLNYVTARALYCGSHVVPVVDRSGPWSRFLRSGAVAKQHLTGTGCLIIRYSSLCVFLVCVTLYACLYVTSFEDSLTSGN